MNDEADRNEPFLHMIKEGAAARAIVEGPAERMLDEARLALLGRHSPQLFQADAVFLRVAPLLKPEARNELFRQRAARALGEEHIFAAKLHAARESRLSLHILG